MLSKVLKRIYKKLSIDGHIDFVSSSSISGWLMDSEKGSPLNVALKKGDALLAATPVDIYRADLDAIGKINPSSGFTLALEEDIDFSNIGQYSLFINGKYSKYATSELRKVVSQMVISRLSVNDDVPQLKKDRDWLIKMRGEDEREINYLKQCEAILEDMIDQNGGLHSNFGKQYLNAKDDKDIEDLVSMDISYDEKKAGFSYIAENILERDLENEYIDLNFEQHDDPKVSIILVLYNKAELTYQCLKSIKQESSLPYELIIIDNDSTDKTQEMMKNVSGVTYIKNTDNVGFLKACNQAREYVNSEYILLLNNDALLKPGTLKAGIDVFSLDSDIGVVGGKILHLDGMMQEAGSIIWSDASCLGYGRREHPDHYKYTYRREVDYVSGALFFTPVNLWDELGGFDERLAPCYYEETDYCIRVAKRGLKILMEPKCQITHFEFGSSSYSDFAVKQMEKNKVVIQEIHADFLEKKLQPKPENIELAARVKNKKTVLYMDDQVPFDLLGSGFPRAQDVISEIKKTANVMLYPFCDNSNWGDMAQYDDVIILPFAEHEALEYISSVLGEIDIVWVSRPHNMEKLIERGWLDLFRKNDIQVVYDAEALFSEREKLRCDLKGLGYDSSVEEKEFELIKSADVVVAVSDAEREKINNRLDKDVHVIGHPCSIKEVNKKETNEILFVGNLVGDAENSPNVDSVDYFLDNYGSVLKGEDLKLVLVGKVSEENKERWQSENVLVEGAVDSLDEYFERAICTIAPTRFAAGIPHKIHESLSWATPILATELILEQCGFESNEIGGLLSGVSLARVVSDKEYRNNLLSLQMKSAENDMNRDYFGNSVASILCSEV